MITKHETKKVFDEQWPLHQDAIIAYASSSRSQKNINYALRDMDETDVGK